jgi:hypothetical protein
MKLVSEIADVNVSSQPGVVGQVPAVVIGVRINYYVVTVPVPVVGVGQVKRGDAEVEAAKPETVGAAAFDVPHMSASKAAFESAVLPGMIEVKADIVPAIIVPDPFAVAMDVRGFGMAFMVVEVPVVIVSVSTIVMIAFMGLVSGRAVMWDVSAANVVVVIAVVVVLRQGRHREDQGRR